MEDVGKPEEVVALADEGLEVIKEYITDFLGYDDFDDFYSCTLLFPDAEYDCSEYIEGDTEEIEEINELNYRVNKEGLKLQHEGFFVELRTTLLYAGIDADFMDWRNFGYLEETETGDIIDQYINAWHDHFNYMSSVDEEAKEYFDKIKAENKAKAEAENWEA
jgi:hypothetical protein